MMPRTHAGWAAHSEAYAELIAEHLHCGARWLDAGCGSRLLEGNLDSLEDWLVRRCGLIVGMDICVRSHRNIKVLVQGSLYALPFADNSLDLVTCNMVVEHLEDPALAMSEIARCLGSRGRVVIQTPYLVNYGVFANDIAAKIIPETWRLRLVHASDGRAPDDVFPVQYRANTIRRLTRLLQSCGMEVDEALALAQNRPFLRKAAILEDVLMKLTPNSRLLISAHKRAPR
jgi:SAM-dependent methyltransferase